MNEKVNETTAGIKTRRDYYKQWRKNNPEKVKAAQIRYWNKRALRTNSGTAESELNLERK